MIDALATTVIVLSLVLAAWSLITTLRDRPVDLSHRAGAAVVEAAMLVQAVLALLPIADGRGPQELATFLGYLLVAVLILPAGLVLAKLEPTRWGSAILAVTCVVLPVLVIRLQQVWGSAGG